jgi:hypothetical protein
MEIRHAEYYFKLQTSRKAIKTTNIFQVNVWIQVKSVVREYLWPVTTYSSRINWILLDPNPIDLKECPKLQNLEVSISRKN